MLPKARTYEELIDAFRWEIPEHYNIGIDVCDKWADRDPDRTALIQVDEQGRSDAISFGKLRGLSNRLAQVLHDAGINKGDRVGILLGQCTETAYAHIGIHKLGAVSLPLFTLFGPDALDYRLADSGARALITDRAGAEKIAHLKDRLPDLKRVFVVDGPSDHGEDLGARLQDKTDQFDPVVTRAEDPAVLIYTSGTTGQPKGALHAHRVLLGHLPGVEMSHDLFPQPDDIIWTPADWAWIGGLLDVLMPALHHGVPVVTCRFRKFTGRAAMDLIRHHNIRNAFLPPTALKLIRSELGDHPEEPVQMRTVACGGETLGRELLDWGRRAFGVTINEFYGQTECNMIVSSCAALMPPRPGIMGRPVPGHRVSIVDDAGTELPPGQQGLIAVHRPDPVMFLGYWNNPDATAVKFAGDWMLTGDTGVRDDQGWIRFVGRDDDVITSGGYRIGPGEIEDCLLGHPQIAMAAVIGKPDSMRTEIVKAYIVLKQTEQGDDALKAEIQAWVKERLAAHEYPREIEFVESLPMTTTGKIIRRALRERAKSGG
ncbi:acyl-CoA synthetase [Saccharospirillum salsuginis]|uniref:Acetyl-CoA synthetase n=1 Tax=Saccharospirillum salsuginis TaxID=418750 RepID=A0A918KJW4_9GAMM|nr:acyl-CoA synthetase [Saccharospirillum salsuginis]GGX65285.1 acetyl-CoA synthetase [Saccharospirillum salsuginis]